MKITEYRQVWEIWNSSKEKLHAYVLSRFKNQVIAEEVSQEVLLKIYNSCCSEKEITNLNSWLYKIAHNTSLDILKKESHSQNSVDFDNTINDSEKWDELSTFLEPLIDFLPEKYGVPLKMSDLDKIDQKEIALKLGLGHSATKSRIQRARKLLREEIELCFHLELDKNGVLINADLKTSCRPLQKLKEKK
ncbi:sigma-70 family RNA polymerase sigma factor [Marinigracilibium pacificum]|uniref:Sigma-70 family RNA polymerase sigma factor n=1 Tax=Marinigracilibium pacificum TaxID=2729599 RepID=A0A848J1T4_9BACT|nr:sigma-70 family RNA polymerase sigma factor [Marinigracilibium pacificum]NMM50783.1 sigma-70 family RNA polymerase sigma factor [Marinigracilibium pacificum]